MGGKTIKVSLAGAGAFGTKHLDGIRNIDGVEVVSLVSAGPEEIRWYGSHAWISAVWFRLKN